MEDKTANTRAVPKDEDVVSFVQMANTLLRNWRVFAVLPVSFALLAGVWSLTRDRTYAVAVTFMPQATDSRGASGALALAQQFGVNLGTDKPGQSPEFYVDMLGSTTLLRQAVEAEYNIVKDNGRQWNGSLVDYWQFDGNGPQIPPWRQAVDKLSDAISTSVSRESGIVYLSVSSDHPVLTEQIAKTLLELLNEFNLEVRQSRGQEESRFIGGRMNEAEKELVSAEDALQEFLRQNREFHNSPELQFQHDRLQRNVLMRQEVYTSLVRSQEQARIDAVRDIPLFTVIDHPAGTAEPEGRGTVVNVILAFLLGVIISTVVALIKEFTRRSQAADDPNFREFQALTRQAWDGVWSPRQWIAR